MLGFSSLLSILLLVFLIFQIKYNLFLLPFLPRPSRNLPQEIRLFCPYKSKKNIKADMKASQLLNYYAGVWGCIKTFRFSMLIGTSGVGIYPYATVEELLHFWRQAAFVRCQSAFLCSQYLNNLLLCP